MQLLFSALTTQSANIAEEGRSLAAVMIRRVITAEFSEFFPKLSAEQQASFKSDLLVVLQQEPSRTVRKKLADLVAELARSLIDDEGNNMWPEFLKFLFELASSGWKAFARAEGVTLCRQVVCPLSDRSGRSWV